MKTLILYNTKYGITKKYAQWIQEELAGSQIFNIINFDTNVIQNYDNVVFGSNTYLGKLAGLDFLVNNWNKLQTKNVYLFSVGFFPPDSEESTKTYISIPEYIREKIQYIKLPGIINSEELEFFDKMIVTGINTEKMEIKKSNIEPIVEYIKSLETK